MRVLIQRVKSASINTNTQVIEHIGKGILLFTGFTQTDTTDIVDKIVSKILKLRIFEDEDHKTNLSVNDVSADILSVSQFTLYANLKGYNRPSFTSCLEYNEASELFTYFNNKLKESSLNVKCGIFGSDILVNIVNDGPFTIILDSLSI
ncbi:MAG: D-tyrosyl-tRNA(Tyr) deacylase [Acholeplasmatales bacterium]|jgi:D-tyrosyl-tRNA(Tyr) deacylase|nr:D-tyrosyl-tRNA(Tyr) deacylase [Acholeplasmatales bacterium]